MTSSSVYRHTSGTAIVAFVLALVGVFVLPIFLGVIAVLLGVLAIEQILTDDELTGWGWAVVAIAVGILTIFLGAVGFALNDTWEWSLWRLY